MKNLITYDPSFNNQYFKDDHLELEELTKITSLDFIKGLMERLMLFDVNKLVISNIDECSKFIFIYASEYNYATKHLDQSLFDCYYNSESGYYKINHISAYALQALDLQLSTINQLK